MSFLKLANINTGYDKKQVLYDISMEVQKGETLLIVGSNGSGKSTLLKLIYGLLDVWSGTVEYEDCLLHNDKQRTPTHTLLHKGIMYIPQKNALFEDMSVEENIYSSLLYLDNSNMIRERMDQIWDEFSALKNKKKQLASHLSGGERKLLSLAMVVANRPKLLLYDEPLAGISEENISIVLYWLGKIRQEGTTIILVEHRIKEIIDFTSNVRGLKLGFLLSENLNSLNKIKQFMI